MEAISHYNNAVNPLPSNTPHILNHKQLNCIVALLVRVGHISEVRYDNIKIVFAESRQLSTYHPLLPNNYMSFVL
jgi:hypothetical protein